MKRSMFRRLLQVAHELQRICCASEYTKLSRSRTSRRQRVAASAALQVRELLRGHRGKAVGDRTVPRQHPHQGLQASSRLASRTGAAAKQARGVKRSNAE
ncbi:hypothetical protein E2562_033990 [Oryza meyeriana var. granulata]|uniref:Uncharacterized protein n=1 Tax=Oryza meyeriana var. granulata TaxID=110450 RepID=A0A6G1ES78_9ORYZ|nr:hypothetical protein E2562_033990 [Oryza meyeriana var. granulata]